MWDTEEKRFMNHSRVIESRILSLENNGEDRFVFQQWTGLLDKHGKEIYEGDILESNHKLFRFEVIWSEDWAMFTVKGDSVGSLIRWATYCEVIGNIYENPELLKGE